MKKYKVEYWRRSLDYLTEISKSGGKVGVKISFLTDGRKECEENWKNDLMNGIQRRFLWYNPKNSYFENWKKDKQCGIAIDFK